MAKKMDYHPSSEPTLWRYVGNSYKFTIGVLIGISVTNVTMPTIAAATTTTSCMYSANVYDFYRGKFLLR